MLQIILKHVQKVHDFRFIVHKREHDHSESILKLCMFVKLVQDHVGIDITPKLNTDSHSLTA